MKAFVLALRGCLVLAAALALQWPAPAAAQPAAARGFLWEATRAGERVLLLGAIHVGRPQFATFSSGELPHLMRAEVIAFEANIFDAQSTFAATRRWAMYPPDAPGLDAVIDTALMARVETIIERSGGNLAVCCRMKPWMIANTLVVLEAMRNGFSPAYGSEAVLYEFAQSTGKPVIEIEGVDAQLRLFDEAATPTQVDYLRHAVETIESGANRVQIERLVGAWERGDARDMERLVEEMARGERAAERFVAERIVGGRHPKMIQAIEQYAASGRLHLVAIGALHYFGPNGLLQALARRGFALRRLP